MKSLEIFEIERFAIYDGPGIRTTIFFQGCPLRCKWCSNPESQEINKCVADNIKSLDEIYKIILKDKDYFDESGGGVTLSGGEALLQIDKAMELLRKFKENNIHIAVETCGCVQVSDIKKANSVIDLFLFDIKSLNKEKLKKYTGGELKFILNCFEYMAKNNPEKLIVRIPVIPKFNDSMEEMLKIYEYLTKWSIKKIDLLPYHTLGVPKYKKLGLIYEYDIELKADMEHISILQKIGEERGFDINVY